MQWVWNLLSTLFVTAFYGTISIQNNKNIIYSKKLDISAFRYYKIRRIKQYEYIILNQSI